MKSIRNRLNLIYCVLMLIALSIFSGLLIYPLENYFLKQAEDNLAPQVRLVAELSRPYLINQDYASLRKMTNKIGKENKIRITVINVKGKVLADSEHDYRTMDNHFQRPEVVTARTKNIGYSVRLSDTLKQDMLYCAAVVKTDSNSIGYVRVAIALKRMADIYSYLKKLLLSVLLVVVLLALTVGNKTAQSITDPIAKLKKTAEEIAGENFAARADINRDDELGELAKAINIMAEKLKLYVQKINVEKEQLEIIFEHLGAGVVVFNAHQEILLINTFAENIFNVKHEALRGQPLKYLIREEEFNDELKEVIREGQARDYEFRYNDSNLQIHFVPINYADGEKKIVVLIYDITSIRQLQQMRADFVANASHELRTPLTAIRGYTETLLDGALEDQATAYSFLQIIDRESDRLTRIVEDLLDLSRLERRAPLQKTNFSLKELVDSTVQKFQKMLLDKEIKFSNQITPEIRVDADYDWLGQVFVNLVDNAIKYSKEDGLINITARQTDNEIIVDVADTGIGIPYEDVSRIFERFYRVDKSRSRSLGGTGLGLSIVKHIVESHGGKVAAKSALGEGTTISFTLPLL